MVNFPRRKFDRGERVRDWFHTSKFDGPKFDTHKLHGHRFQSGKPGRCMSLEGKVSLRQHS